MSTYSICPTEEKEWKAATAARSIGSIHGLTKTSSASSLEVDQFLALKVIWKMEDDINVLRRQSWATRIGTTPEKISTAREKLKKEGAWKAYLDALTKHLPPNASFPHQLGRFAMVLQNQSIVTRLTDAKHDKEKVVGSPITTRSGLQLGVDSIAVQWGPGVVGIGSEASHPQREHSSPPRPESRPRSKEGSESSKGKSEATIISEFDYTMSKAERAAMADEQVVNTAAISFLQSLFVHKEARNAYWSPLRKGFRFGQTDFKAYTDGHLQIMGDSRSAALLEVKARRRPKPDDDNFKIEWQESAQMALWIRDEPSSFWTTEQDRHKCSRILISQDHSEMFLTIAEYDDSYLDYMQNKKSLDDAGFLTMHRFGPFSTQSSSNMDLLAGILEVLVPYAATFPPQRKSPSPSPEPAQRSASGERGRPLQTPQISGATSRQGSPRAEIADKLRGISLAQGPSRISSRSSSESPSRAAQRRSQLSESRPPTEQSSGQQVSQPGGQQRGQNIGARGQGRGRGRGRGRGA